MNEIEQLNEHLFQRNGETQLLINSFEREKEMLIKENERLTNEIKEERVQSGKKQANWGLKNSELKEKLDKAF